MSTLQQIRNGMSDAWYSLVEGWQHLYRRATGALTRFTPSSRNSETSGTEGRLAAVRNAGWALLAGEVFDDENRIVIRLEVPGLEKEDFNIQVLDDVLVVRGRKQVIQERSMGQYHLKECAYGSFERAFALPDEVHSDQAVASYRRGVLRVELPKSGHRKGKTRKIKIS